ncbi:bile acid:sodium symporter family protein [Photobacterium sp. OFAV2-7]|uniref:bile acid:sodium symporter family protein n=1 Tax=Photobacterium sp. OFAV2-7 TaxID=2917748 RepID=UPI001EF6D61C|nr:bile acid:sodium symporter [Photobacterium sp. OFAV2-7]MCG7587941.1 bile acid:sodium symporter [Photobacterium sp. OFAV2-7]
MSQTMLTVALPIALAWMMYCVGLTLSTTDFKRVGQYPGRVLMGLVAQLLGLPLLAYVIITLFALPEPVAIGLWLLALAPGGASSNAITHMSGGDSALSISMTAVSSLIIPFSLPLMLVLLVPDTQLVFPLKTAILQLTAVTLIPVLLGMATRHWAKGRWFEGFSHFAGRSALGALFLTVMVTVAANTGVFHQLFSVASVAALSLCVAGMLLGASVAKMLRGDRVLTKTLSIEVGVQNAGTAIFVAVVQLQRPELALTPLLYGLLMNLPAFAMIYVYQRRKLASV